MEQKTDFTGSSYGALFCWSWTRCMNIIYPLGHEVCWKLENIVAAKYRTQNELFSYSNDSIGYFLSRQSDHIPGLWDNSVWSKTNLVIFLETGSAMFLAVQFHEPDSWNQSFYFPLLTGIVISFGPELGLVFAAGLGPLGSEWSNSPVCEHR